MADGSMTTCPRAVRPATAAHSCRTPRCGLSRVCGVLGFKRLRRQVLCIALSTRLLRRCVLRIALIARDTRFKCEHTLGVTQHKSRLGPTLSVLNSYRCGELIKHQQCPPTTFLYLMRTLEIHTRSLFLTSQKSGTEDVYI